MCSLTCEENLSLFSARLIALLGLFHSHNALFVTDENGVFFKHKKSFVYFPQAEIDIQCFLVRSHCNYSRPIFKVSATNKKHFFYSSEMKHFNIISKVNVHFSVKLKSFFFLALR